MKGKCCVVSFHCSSRKSFYFSVKLLLFSSICYSIYELAKGLNVIFNE